MTSPARSSGSYAPDTFAMVADIGGTNTRVALAEETRLLPETVRKYPNSAFADLDSVLRQFIADTGDVDCKGACVAVAGPVRDGIGVMTNLDWHIDRDTLARAARAENVAILNDLQAQGHALEHIAPENLARIIDVTDPGSHAARLVIGVGTGFNVAPVFSAESGRLVTPSEAGHANMPIRTEADLRLCRFVETAHGFGAIEDVLSGRGLERIHAWLGHEAGEDTTASAAEIMAGCGDGSDPRAERAVEVFVRLLGTVAGNMALIHLPFGGIYFSGGVARAMTPYLDRFGFADAFRDKGRFGELMKTFAVSVIEDDFAALAGCASHLSAQTR